MAFSLLALTGLLPPLGAPEAAASHGSNHLDCINETIVTFSNSIDCLVTDQAGNVAPNTFVDAEVTGANDPDDNSNLADPDLGCQTNAQGRCFLIHNLAEEQTGLATYRIWVDSSPGIEADATEGPDEVVTPGAVIEPDNTDVVTNSIGATRLDCINETAVTFGNTVDCLATDAYGNVASGVDIDVEVTGANDPDDNANLADPDLECETNAQGRCFLNHNLAEEQSGLTTYRAWIDFSNLSAEADVTEGPDEIVTPGLVTEPDNTDVVTNSIWATRLDCINETSVRLQGFVDCLATDAYGNVLSGVDIHVEVTGANDPDDNANLADPDLECETDAQGRCFMIHNLDEEVGGLTTYRAWIDFSNLSAEADVTEGPDEIVTPGLVTEPDNTDVVTNSIGATRLDCINETSVRLQGFVDCLATDAYGNVLSGVNIDLEVTGANNLDGNANLADPDLGCETDARGRCFMIHNLEAEAGGLTTYRAWIDFNNLSAEADVTEGPDELVTPGTVTEPDNTDVVTNSIWATRLDCTNETGASLSNEIQCLATDAYGNFMPGVAVDVEITGANDPDDNANLADPDLECETDSQGRCFLTHNAADNENGLATYRAWIDFSNVSAEADVTEGPDELVTPGAGLEPDNTDVVTNTFGGVAPVIGPPARTDCTRESASAEVGPLVRVFCYVTDAGGNPVGGTTVFGEISGAGNGDGNNDPATPEQTCVTDLVGRCFLSFDSDAAGLSTYRLWADVDGSATSVEADATEEHDEASVPGSAAEPDRTDVVRIAWGASRLDCVDETRTVFPGTSQSITCFATDAFGNSVANARVFAEFDGVGNFDNDNDPAGPDAECTTDFEGRCNIPHIPPIDESGVTTYRIWLDGDNVRATLEVDATEGPDENLAPGSDPEPDGTDVVRVGRGASRLDCVDETRTVDPGTSQDITCLATDAFGNFVAGATVRAEFDGVGNFDNDNDPASQDELCQTDLEGRCNIPHTTPFDESGVTTYRIWLDGDNDVDTLEVDTTEGPVEGSVPGSGPEPDGTDVVRIAWGASRLDCVDESRAADPGTPIAIVCLATDAFGNFVPNVRVFAEFDGVGNFDNNNDPADPDAECMTDLEGRCSIQHTPPTRQAGATTYRIWLDADNDEVTLQADATEGLDEGAVAGAGLEPDGTDVVRIAWGASRLDCVDETLITDPGTPSIITCLATNAFGNTVAAAPVFAEFEGVGNFDGNADPSDPEDSCDTDLEGRCQIQHLPPDDEAGPTTYRLWLDADDDQVTLEADTTEGPVESAVPGLDPEPDGTDVLRYVRGASRLDCLTETASLATGSSRSITCTARNDFDTLMPNIEISLELDGANELDGNTPDAPDDLCVTGADGTCGFTHNGANPGTTTYRAWIDVDGDTSSLEADLSEGLDETTVAGDLDEIDGTDVVSTTWTTPPVGPGPGGGGGTGAPMVLDCEPETDDRSGSSHSLLCTATVGGSPHSGANLDVEISGSNDPDGSFSPTTPELGCRTSANGSCEVAHVVEVPAAGTSFYTVWIDETGTDLAFEGDGREGQDETVGPGERQEPDSTDAVTKTWRSTTASPPPVASEPPIASPSIASPSISSTAVSATPSSPSGFERDVSLEAGGRARGFQKPMTLTGRITSTDPSCALGVVRIIRTPFGGDQAETFDLFETSDDGTFTKSYLRDHSANYSAIAEATPSCREASSSTVPVLVSVRVRLIISDDEVQPRKDVELTVFARPCTGHENDFVLFDVSGKETRRRLSDGCEATLLIKPRRSKTVQAVWPKQDTDHEAGRSKRKDVTVTP